MQALDKGVGDKGVGECRNETKEHGHLLPLQSHIHNRHAINAAVTDEKKKLKAEVHIHLFLTSALDGG
jgi:hypothetical protein